MSIIRRMRKHLFSLTLAAVWAVHAEKLTVYPPARTAEEKIALAERTLEYVAKSVPAEKLKPLADELAIDREWYAKAGSPGEKYAAERAVMSVRRRILFLHPDLQFANLLAVQRGLPFSEEAGMTDQYARHVARRRGGRAGSAQGAPVRAARGGGRSVASVHGFRRAGHRPGRLQVRLLRQHGRQHDAARHAPALCRGEDGFLPPDGSSFAARDAAESAQAPARSEFPIEAVREAIVNAVCHRDYTDDGSVQVMLFRDRLEVLNPGTLPRGWTAANLLQTHDSKPHNGILATAMQWAGYVEKSGYGTEDIVRKCKAWGLRDPEYHPSAVDFRLVLWRQEIKEPRDFTQLGEVGEVGCPKGVESSGARGVESDARSPIKSRVCDSSNRLYPPAAMGVESRGGVVHSLRDLILLSVVQQPKSRAEIARSLGKPRIFGNLVRRITTLLDDDLIELTVPDKPNSRLQKYRITKKGRQVAKLLA